jgi:hypothetical protein
MMMEMRQKNLFVFIVLPTIFLLDKYVALWRTVGLFHVYSKKGKRGFWIFFNRRKKKLLYLNGKKDYSYSGKGIPSSNFKGRFLDQYVVDEVEYRRRKLFALENKSWAVDGDEDADRDVLLWLICDEFKVPPYKLVELLKKYGLELGKSTIYTAVEKAKKNFVRGD